MDTVTIVIACIVASVVLIISVVILRKLRQSSAKSMPSWSSQKAPGYNIGSAASDAEALRKKFEHCGGSELLSPRSDGIRLDEIIRQEETPDTPSPQLLRLDAAVPNKVQLNKAFDLAVTVRQTSSPVLSEDDLPVVKSGDVQASWPKSQSYVRLRIQVSAPDCEIHGEDNRLFRLFWGQDSPMFYFHLTPKKQGVISIIVRVYQEHDWLGSARVHTIAYEQIVGSVQVEITSQKMESTTPSLTTLSITPLLILVHRIYCQTVSSDLTPYMHNM
jgi:hypothetical protein